MREYLAVEKKREALSLITAVTYANVESWYGATRRDLHMDLIVPKNRENHRPLPTIVWFCGGAFRVMDRSVWMPELMRFAEAASALMRITPSAPPHLILQGLDDTVVSPEQSRNYYEALVEKGVGAELIEIEGAQHGDDLFFQDAVKERVIHFLQGEV